MAIHFTIDYINADGFPSNYYPDFIVRVNEKETVIIETKCQEDLDVPQKMNRLKQWCEDINKAQNKIKFDFIYVDEDSFHKYKPKIFRDVLKGFREYKE